MQQQLPVTNGDVIFKVERALELTIHGHYDFEKNTLIAMPDPNHVMQKPTTAMFAFSESVWQPRATFYLEKSIMNLKTKDWESIMDAAADYSQILREKKGKAKNRARPTEEEQELEYVSDSEED
jgi:hypothetical protein